MSENATAPLVQVPRPGSSGLARIIAIALPATLLGGALGSQYFGGLHPCEMCHWQRWPHYLALFLAMVAFSGEETGRRARLFTMLAAMSIAVSGAIGVYHAGVEAGWWAGATTCSATGAKTMAEILATPLVRCDEVQFSFLGISMAGWNAIISLSGAALIIALLARRR